MLRTDAVHAMWKNVKNASDFEVEEAVVSPIIGESGGDRVDQNPRLIRAAAPANQQISEENHSAIRNNAEL